jgi:hypothetical protein
MGVTYAWRGNRFYKRKGPQAGRPEGVPSFERPAGQFTSIMIPPQGSTVGRGLRVSGNGCVA